MKNCPNCNAEVENSFELCWNCNYSFTEERIIQNEEIYEEGTRDIDCIRCNVRMIYTGQYKFHEGAPIGVLGNFFEWFVNRQPFDIYVCPKCGKAELFTPLSKQ